MQQSNGTSKLTARTERLLADGLGPSSPKNLSVGGGDAGSGTAPAMGSSNGNGGPSAAGASPTANNGNVITARAPKLGNGEEEASSTAPVVATVSIPFLHARASPPSDGPLTAAPSSSQVSRPLDPSLAVDRATVYRNLWLFIWLKTIGSFDSGAFSAALGAPDGISEAWELSTKLQGTLTSSVFLGNVLGCPLAGHLFSRHDEKRVLCAALVVHTVFTFLFAAFPVYGLALLNRFFIGISLSFIVVYTPIWVDEFAPKNRQSVWMASHNAGVPLGIMFGYLLAAAPQSFTTSIGWSWSFYVKCVLMVPTIAYVARVDARTINTRKLGTDGKGGADDEHEAESGLNAAEGANGGALSLSPPPPVTSMSAATPSSARPVVPPLTLPQSALQLTELPRHFVDRVRRLSLSFYATLTPLFTNVVYMCSVVSLTSLYFVATGLQNFVTQYLREPPFSASMTAIMIGFGSAVVSAPVCGVIAGGILLDRIGGYKRNLRRVAVFVLAWGLCAVLFSVICIFVRTTRGFLLVMSVVLFCGGALIPPGAGLTMASLPDHLRSVGAAFSQTIYNLLGNFSGPLVCGFVADVTGNLRYGIITLLLSSALGVVPIVGILYVAFSGSGGRGSGGGGGADAQSLGGADSALLASRDAFGGSGEDALGPTEEEIAVVAVTYGEDGALRDEREGIEMTSYREAGSCEAPARKAAPVRMPSSSPRLLPPHQHRSGASAAGPPTSRHEMEVESPRRTTVVPGADCSRRTLSESALPMASAMAATPPPAGAATATESAVQSASASMPALTGGPLLNSTAPSQVSRVSSMGRQYDLPGPLHGPGTARPISVSAKTSLTSTGAASLDTSAPTYAQRRRERHKADLELLTLEAEAAKVMSLPNQRAFGMDLVRTWLNSDVREPHGEPARRTGGGAAGSEASFGVGKSFVESAGVSLPVAADTGPPPQRT